MLDPTLPNPRQSITICARGQVDTAEAPTTTFKKYCRICILRGLLYPDPDPNWDQSGLRIWIRIRNVMGAYYLHCMVFIFKLSAVCHALTAANAKCIRYPEWFTKSIKNYHKFGYLVSHWTEIFILLRVKPCNRYLLCIMHILNVCTMYSISVQIIQMKYSDIYCCAWFFMHWKRSDCYTVQKNLYSKSACKQNNWTDAKNKKKKKWGGF